jgi:hypothetical protein
MIVSMLYWHHVFPPTRNGSLRHSSGSTSPRPDIQLCKPAELGRCDHRCDSSDARLGDTVYSSEAVYELSQADLG